jgi:Sulfotransferase family
MTGQDQEPELALIVGAARSGTTLQRALLDAHPEIACPPEAGLPSLMSHMARVWGTINSDMQQDAPATDPGQPEPGLNEGPAAKPDEAAAEDTAPVANPGPILPEPAREWIRATMLAAIRSYCDRENKRLYVDKSLDSVYYLELVRQLFPNVKCILAIRHVMDTIASGIEASPWGFQAYGYAPYVQRFPGNTVAALANYWLDHVTGAVEWEKQHPELCLRVKYEDLVTSPKETVKGIQRFLGVQEHLDVLREAFDREIAPGPADYKIEHTSAVHAQSIGNGKRVPVSMLPPPLLAAINEKLEELGYPPLDRSWNTAEREMDAPTETIWSGRLQTLMNEAQLRQISDDLIPFAVVAEDHRALRWVIDPESQVIVQGDGDVEAVLTGTAEDLVLMLTGEGNLGVLMRSGRVRHLLADENEVTRRNLHDEVMTLVSTLRSSIGEHQHTRV